jgi:hypothetical protein
MILWWAAAVLTAWLVLPPALEGLWASLGDLAEVLGVPARELLKVVGGVAVVALQWRWTQPEAGRRALALTESVSEGLTGAHTPAGSGVGDGGGRSCRRDPPRSTVRRNQEPGE